VVSNPYALAIKDDTACIDAGANTLLSVALDGSVTGVTAFLVAPLLIQNYHLLIQGLPPGLDPENPRRKFNCNRYPQVSQ